MHVSVKLVVFEHPTWSDKYCSYCPELQYFFGRGSTIATVIERVKDNLIWELKGRLHYRNLKIRDWQITENSVIPPTFTDEEAVALTEKSYEMNITDYQIIVINVEVPQADANR
jgi:hypothetical protein